MSSMEAEASIKDRGMLESAVGRQLAGTDQGLHYPTPIENAATLMFGLAMNHPFHDGNKRTALVAMLNHLDRNRKTLREMRWQDVENTILDLVEKKLSQRSDLRHAAALLAAASEKELAALTEWLRRNTRGIERGERSMTYDELEQVLRKHGYEFGHPIGNKMPIYRLSRVTRRRLWPMPPKEEIERTHVGSIGYPGGKREMGVAAIKRVRRYCRLTEEDGADSAVFYDEEKILDDIINRNRLVLRSLADK